MSLHVTTQDGFMYIQIHPNTSKYYETFAGFDGRSHACCLQGCEHPAGSGAMMLEPGVPDVAAAVGQTLGEEGYYKCLLASCL